jgi:peptidyl-prolyl cis-trans isomerase C
MLKKSPIKKIVLFGSLLAIVLLLVFGSKLPSEKDRLILINNEDFNHIIASWTKTWQRPPTKEELQGVMQNYVRDEILYQEALKQGLDKNNGMVKRSLIMQMNMLAEGQFAEREIKDSDILAYYNLRKDQYLQPEKYTFFQLYFSSEKLGNQTKEKVEKIIEELNKNSIKPEAAQSYGDVIMLESMLKEKEPVYIDRTFGDEFTLKISNLPFNEWSGPIQSSFGWHAIYMMEKSDAKPEPLETVKEEILREMTYEEKEAAKEQFYTELLQQYKVVYEGEAKNIVNVE